MRAEIVDQTTGEIVSVDGLQFLLPGDVSAVSLDLPEGLSFEAWETIGRQLQSIAKSLMWWLGDWVLYGERHFGEAYVQAMELSGKAENTCLAAKWVAQKFPSLRRRNDLSWQHHREASSLDEDEAESILNDAQREGWSTRDLRAEVSRRKTARRIDAPANGDACTAEDLDALVATGCRFGTIYADPPWRYSNTATRASGEKTYDGTMSVEEIAGLPVSQLAAADAHLHLWTTNGFLFECPKLFEAWGFEFKSAFVWTKPQMGIGNYWRNSHEYLLTAVRGDAKHFNDHGLKSWSEIDRGEHSAKPEQIRKMIEKASPGPYLELFGRRVADGWTVWGNQISRCLFERVARKVA